MTPVPLPLSPPLPLDQDSEAFMRNRGFGNQGAEMEEVLFLMGEGYEFEKEELVQLWMALGLIKDEPMEIYSAAYFDQLLSEGCISGCNSKSTYKVNAGSVNLENKSNCLVLKMTDLHSVEPGDKISHVSVVCNGTDDAIYKILHRFRDLKTLLFHGSCGIRVEQLLCEDFSSFDSLLALDLSGSDVKYLPSSVKKMNQLRYLDLSWTKVEYLPEVVSCMKHLQTLKLIGCYRLQRLPRSMKMLTELRHLEFDILGQLEMMPEGLSALTELRTLSTFLVGDEEGFDIKELSTLNKLSGEFCIARLEVVKSAEDAMCASMKDKTFLKKLDLTWSGLCLRDWQNEVSSESVLNNLRPHSDLEELAIHCYAGESLPSWIGAGESCFHKLTRMTLFHCEHIYVLPAIQFLPSLGYLQLVGLNSLIQVDVRGETGHVAFPRLRTLIIDEMLRVKSWTEAEKGDFPCLAELTLNDCPDLSDFPSLLYLPSMKRLEVSSCPRLQFLPHGRLSTSLEFLIVYECPLFKHTCWEHGAQGWELIQHVLNVLIKNLSFKNPIPIAILAMIRINLNLMMSALYSFEFKTYVVCLRFHVSTYLSLF